MNHLAFVPARGGSVGIPNKNLQKIAGKSLIARTWEHVQESETFQSYILSTDSFEIAVQVYPELNRSFFDHMTEDSIMKFSDESFLHKRASDDAQTLSPIRKTLFNLAHRSELNFDLLWMFQPTSPFRRIEQTRAIKVTAEESDAWSSIVSLKDTGGMHPDRMYRLNGNLAKPYMSQAAGDNVPRQLLEKLYIKDGAYYVLKRENLVVNIMLGENVLPVIRNGDETINIDTWDDLRIAQIFGGNAK